MVVDNQKCIITKSRAAKEGFNVSNIDCDSSPSCTTIRDTLRDDNDISEFDVSKAVIVG